MKDQETRDEAGKAEKKLYDCLFRGDPRVCVLLGDQELPGEGQKIRGSRFVYSLQMEGTALLFHTLTRELLAMPPTSAEYFAEGRLFPASVLEEELPAKLYSHHFLVPEDTPESQTYLEVKDVLVLKEELPNKITHYVILPTTTCNARCFYCFEQGMKYRKMSAETVEDTLRFILEHKPEDGKKIHIHWFGGEPMCAADNIDCICKGLTDAGIGFTAEMTSNGSLFTEESARKAAEEWKIGKIQITLDGMEEEYARRKNYSSAVQDPFATVIRNIHCLIKAGIGVAVRLNADENNLAELFRVVDFLKEEFTAEEKKKMRVYCHSLFGPRGEGLDACPVGSGTDALETRVLELNDYILRQGLTIHDLGVLFSLKSHYCMVTAPECNALIDAEGRLFACDAMPENMCYGSVRTGIDPEAWKKVAEPCAVRKECEDCVFLPQCTEFDRCPNRMAYDACFRQEARKLERELRFVWEIRKAKQQEEQQAEKTQAGEESREKAEEGNRADPKEAPHGSD